MTQYTNDAGKTWEEAVALRGDNDYDDDDDDDDDDYENYETYGSSGRRRASGIRRARRVR